MSKRGLKFYSYESYELLKLIKQKLHLWRTCFQALTLVSMISFKYQKTLQMKCLGWLSGTLTQRFTCKDFFWGEKRFTINTCGEVKATGLGRDRWRQRGDADIREASAHPEELWSYPALIQHGQAITLLTLTQLAPREWAWPWARQLSYAEGNFTPSSWGNEDSSRRGRKTASTAFTMLPRMLQKWGTATERH